MAVSSPTYKPIVGTGAKSILVKENTTVAGEVTINLPATTRSLVLRSRTTCILKVYTTNAGDFITVNPYCVLKLEGLELSGQDIYISSSVSVVVIETILTLG